MIRPFLAIFSLALLSSSAARAAEPAVQRALFGRAADGTTIDAFTLTNRSGATAKIITFGAVVADLQIPDRNGKLAHVVREVVFSEENYQRGFPQSAMIAGRVANRIANARFSLDGHDYPLIANNGGHTLHSGPKGFGKIIWQGAPVASTDGAAVMLSYFSPDGDCGFPGNLKISVTYTLTDANVLRLEFHATTDKPTPINVTNHAFFNLAGGGDVTDYVLTLQADRFTPADATGIPSGEIVSVKGTPLDFTVPAALGARAHQLGATKRYDNNFVITRTTPGLIRAAHIADPKSGRTLEVWTTEPGLQLYTSPLDAPTAAGRVGFFCLESQHFPDSVHHENFPSTILRPGETFSSTTEFRFR